MRPRGPVRVGDVIDAGVASPARSSGSACAPPVCATSTGSCGTSPTARSSGSGTSRSSGPARSSDVDRSRSDTDIGPATEVIPGRRQLWHDERWHPPLSTSPCGASSTSARHGIVVRLVVRTCPTSSGGSRELRARSRPRSTTPASRCPRTSRDAMVASARVTLMLLDDRNARPGGDLRPGRAPRRGTARLGRRRLEAAERPRPGYPGPQRARPHRRRGDHAVRAPVPEAPSRPDGGCVTDWVATRAAFSGLTNRGGDLDDETWDELEETLLLADVGLPDDRADLCDGVARPGRGPTAPPTLIELPEVLAAELAAHARRAAAPDRTLQSRVRVTERLDVRRRQRRRQDHHHRQARRERRSRRADRSCSPPPTRSGPPPPSSSRTGPSVSASTLVRGQEGADPGSVVVRRHEARPSARRRPRARRHRRPPAHQGQPDGRAREAPPDRRAHARARSREVLLVLDATTGQNGLTQAREFTDAVDVTGVVLTKLDGTAKGGDRARDRGRARRSGEADRRSARAPTTSRVRPGRVRRRARRDRLRDPVGVRHAVRPVRRHLHDACAGKGRLTEKEIDEVARELRLALLEADVNVRVVKQLHRAA